VKIIQGPLLLVGKCMKQSIASVFFDILHNSFNISEFRILNQIGRFHHIAVIGTIGLLMSKQYKYRIAGKTIRNKL